MILENGIIRTLDPSLPTARALAIAGARIAGGVGVHETALASPDASISAAAASSPASPTRTSTSRRGRSRSGRCSSTERVARGGARARARRRVAPADAGCAATAGATATGTAVEPTKEALDAVTGETPDAPHLEGLPLGSGSTRRRSRAPAATSTSTAASSSATRRGEPTGILREESAWRFRDRYVASRPRTSASRRRAQGCKLAASRGVGAIHDKDGWLGAPGIFQRLPRRGEPHAARLAVDPARAARRELGELALRSGLRRRRTCGSAT